MHNFCTLSNLFPVEFIWAFRNLAKVEKKGKRRKKGVRQKGGGDNIKSGLDSRAVQALHLDQQLWSTIKKGQVTITDGYNTVHDK